MAPEHFKIARRETRLNDDTVFCAHQKRMIVSDLIAMGLDRDLILAMPSDDSPDFGEETTERLADEEVMPDSGAERTDPAARTVWVTECYVRLDEDGDGYAELRKVLVIGQDSVVILDNERINHNPFSMVCPVPMPHKFFGLSMSDLVMEIQFIRSILLRQMLDNLYLSNNPRTEVVEGQVRIEDLLVSRPGQIVRVRQPGQMREVEHATFSPMAIGMMQFLADERENKTGVTRYNQGNDSQSLNQTAFGIGEIMTAAAARVDMIGRLFSETGLKDLGRKIYQTLCESPMKEFQVHLDDGEWITINPAEFDEEFDITVDVGLGIGGRTERTEFMKVVLELQETLAEMGQSQLVTPDHFYNAAEKLMEAGGFASASVFFNDPQGQPAPPPPPPPNVQVAQVRAQVEQGKQEIEKQRLAQVEQKERALVEHRAQELAQSERLEMERMEMDARTRIEVARIQAEATLEAAAMRGITTLSAGSEDGTAASGGSRSESSDPSKSNGAKKGD